MNLLRKQSFLGWAWQTMEKDFEKEFKGMRVFDFEEERVNELVESGEIEVSAIREGKYVKQS